MTDRRGASGLIRVRPVAVLVACLVLASASCGDDDATPPPESAGTLRVFAAASLTEAFTDLAERFETENPTIRVALNFAASSALAQQITEGAEADVFVSADEFNMTKVIDSSNATRAEVIARNRLSIIVEKGNPKAIGGLADLAANDVVTVLCAPEVPCGKFAAAALSKAAVAVKPSSLEENVKGVVAKITLGEADAGIVYVTDVKAAGDEAQGVAIDIAADPALQAAYPMAVTTKAANPDAAAKWLEFALSGVGQKVLAEHGFLAP